MPAVSLPTASIADFGVQLAQSMSTDLAQIEADLTKEAEVSDSLFKNIREVSRGNLALDQSIKNGIALVGDGIKGFNTQVDGNRVRIEQLMETAKKGGVLRAERLSGIIERFTVVRMLHHFYFNGEMVSKETLGICNDDEYISAVLSLAQDIARYVIGRACEGDTGSIETCRELIIQIQGKMLEFDFRNGPIRRKYDGLKYALKTIEDISFELSLHSSPAEEIGDEPDAKKRRTDSSGGGEKSEVGSAISNTSAFCDLSELESIRLRMSTYDALREQVIKDSRDVQKLSKQSIYAVLRGGLSDARDKLKKALDVAEKTLLVIAEHPTLRSGAFSNSLEEWAEGELTLEWVENKRIKTLTELRVVNVAEYVGALSDFTGEAGRIAVGHASKRQVESVREIQQVDLVISQAITRMNGITPRFSKKLDAVNTNMRKVEDLLFELAMTQRGSRGGKKIVDPAMEEGSKEKNDD